MVLPSAPVRFQHVGYATSRSLSIHGSLWYEGQFIVSLLVGGKYRNSFTNTLYQVPEHDLCIIRGCLDVRTPHFWFVVELVSIGVQDVRDIYEVCCCESEVYGDLQTNGGKRAD